MQWHMAKRICSRSGTSRSSKKRKGISSFLDELAYPFPNLREIRLRHNLRIHLIPQPIPPKACMHAHTLPKGTDANCRQARGGHTRSLPPSLTPCLTPRQNIFPVGCCQAPHNFRSTAADMLHNDTIHLQQKQQK